ncbi:MAG TPA: MFS transporter [bacterium]|nr:MFS transporter [bacterium]
MTGVFSQRRYQMLATAWAAWFVNYLDRTKTAALLPLIIVSLNMNTHQTGQVLFWFFLGYACVQPFAGFFTDLIGPKKMLAVTIGAFSVFTWTMAFVGDWQQLALRNLLFGIAQGFEVTAGSRLSATWFPVSMRGRAFAIHQTAYAIGPILVPFIAVPIAQWTGSWRWSFMVMSFFGLPVLWAIDKFITDRPERDPRITRQELNYIFGEEELQAKHGNVLDPARAHRPDELPPGERLTPYHEIFLNRNVALMFVAGFFTLLANWGLTTWLPTYGVQQLKLPLLIAGTLSSVAYLGTLCGVILGGLLSDLTLKTKRTPVWLIGNLLVVVAIGYASTFRQGVPLALAYATFFAAGFATSWTTTGTLFAPYLSEILTPGAVGRSLGVVVLGSMLGSAVAQPLVASMVVQTPNGPDFHRAFLMFAACGVVGFCCCAALLEPCVRRTYLGYLLSGGREGTWQPPSPMQAA